jgi:GTP 3',8-cyclase
MLDRFGRNIFYLRISLTDRCNLRCVYCMPENVHFLGNKDVMQDDEVIRFVRLFARLGTTKIRLSGGEPTLRAHLVELVQEIARTPGIESLSMTTNGILLPRLAKPLAKAGLQRVNVSLDTLDHAKFHELTRGGNLEDVWEGIRAAEAAGLNPVKLNVVVVRGENDSDVIDLARLTLDYPWAVRFIEMMPLGDQANFNQEQFVTAREIKTRIEAELGALDPVNEGKLDGEAYLYRLAGARADLGFIASVSSPFCASCTRTRLTPDGYLRLCLLRDNEVNLLKPLRAGASDEDLQQIILDNIWQKPWGHGLTNNEIAYAREMNQIGG